MAEHETIRDAAFVSAMWTVQSAELRQLFERDPPAALSGFVEAIQGAPDRIYSLNMHLDLFSLEALEAAGVPERVLERKRMVLEHEQRRAEAPDTSTALGALAERSTETIAADGPEGVSGPPTLSELLARDREQWDEIIAHHSQHYASQVASLAPEEADDLRVRLDEWWPDKAFAETITRQSANSWSQESFAAAWLWLGPPLDKDVTAEQWAELASCGILFHDQTEWLQRKAGAEAKLALARTCTATDSRIWYEALAATPDPLPDELVEAAVTNLKTAEEEHYGVRYIGERLYSAAGVAPLRALSQVSEEFAAALRPLLAADGDEVAQRMLVRQLREQLEAQERPSREDLRWLDAIDNEDLLDDLFACVEILWGRSSPLEETAGWFRSDVLTPVMNAIRNIGGRGAVERYDRLIAKQDGLQFLRGQREAIAQSILRHDGLEAAEQAACELGLPVFPPGGG
jgi:hypothetical protein